ncbi:MAG: inositol monophosphatase [Ruminococcaceae bacterium]|nr:inositol monophosphatase [Oscillospiraceae bacterium]
MEFNEIIELVIKSADLVFDSELKNNVNMKGTADFVTAVDLKISSYLKNELKKLTPDIGFMSEEEEGFSKGKRWILDPIDGTTNLVYDYNMSSVSLAYYNGTKVEFGVIYNPFNKDLFTAISGEGAYLNGQKLEAAPDRELDSCLIEFGAGSTKKQYTEESFAIAKEVFANCLDLRRICSSALAIAYVAAGKLNGYFERVLKPWDYAAAVLMLEECGALSSDWEGKPIQFETPSSFVCGTPKAYNFLLETIQKNKQ